MISFFKRLSRRQIYESDQSSNSDQVSLDRNLKLPTLVFLNVSNSIGSGIYLLTGIASNLHAGPYVALSYLFSGVAAFLAALAYAEFAARINSTSGSSYSFVYFSLGEFIAFLIGWVIFVGSLTSVAATAIAFSDHLDLITNDVFKKFIFDVLHAHWDLHTPFSNHLDLLALIIVIILFMISLRGLQISTTFNNILAILNIGLLAMITVAGFIFGKFENLTSTPYHNGFHGVVKGASIVMYAYMGFESSTFAINEAVNPARNIPLSLVLSLIIINFLYCGSSFSLNLMQPFDKIDAHAAYPTAFQSIKPMYYVVSIGPLISLTGSLVTSIYAISRIAYTMAKDGLLFRFLSRVNPNTKVPDLATFTSLILTVILILCFDVESLIGFTDISTFLVYSMVSVGLLVVRYCDLSNIVEINHEMHLDSVVEANEETESENLLDDNQNELNSSSENLTNPGINVNRSKWCGSCNGLREKLQRRFSIFKSSKYALFIIFYIFISSIVFYVIFNHDYKFHPALTLAITVFFYINNFICLLLLSLFKQYEPANGERVTFKVPLVPLIPILVLLINNYLMMASELNEWIVFYFVIIIGLPIYFIYGMRNSKLDDRNQI